MIKRILCPFLEQGVEGSWKGRQVLWNNRHGDWRNRTENKREKVEGKKWETRNIQEPEDGYNKNIWGGRQPCLPLRQQGPERNQGRGTNGADGGKVWGGNRHDVLAATTTAHMITPHPPPHATYLKNSTNPIHTTPRPQLKIRTAAPTPTSSLPANKKKEGQTRKRTTQRDWGQRMLEPRGQTYYHKRGKHIGGYGVQGTGGTTPPWKQQKPKVTPYGSNYNTMKMHNNLSYYYSCRYDVDHTGWQCQTNTRKRTHITNVGKDETHTKAGASMKVQHNTPTDGSGSGKGWILTQKLRK